MLIYLQRVATSLAVALWFGGFTFYTACVVRVGSKIAGGLTQGYVTQRVTDVLNVLAAIMITTVIIDIAVHWNRVGRWLRLGQCVAWLVMAASVIGVVVVHRQMDVLLDPSTLARPDHDAFKPLHQRYQLISTFLWFATVAYMALMVRISAAMAGSSPALRKST